MSFGFWEVCNKSSSHKHELSKECTSVDFSKNIILQLMRSIYIVGFSFQTAGTALVMLILLISLLASNESMRDWNIHLIFCSSILTLLTIGLALTIVTALIFVSQSKSERVNSTEFPYNTTTKSTSFFACVAAILVSLIVNGLACFSLGFCSIGRFDRHHSSSSSSLSSPANQTSENATASKGFLASCVKKLRLNIGSRSLSADAYVRGPPSNIIMMPPPSKAPPSIPSSRLSVHIVKVNDTNSNI